MREYWLLLHRCLARPTAKQWEAYGRFSHTLSASCVIGGCTMLYASPLPGWQAIVVFAAGLALFLDGVLAFGKADPPRRSRSGRTRPAVRG